MPAFHLHSRLGIQVLSSHDHRVDDKIRGLRELLERSVVTPCINVDEDWNARMVFTERAQQRNELHISNNVVDPGMLKDVLEVICFEMRYCKLDKMQSWCMGVTGHPYDTWKSDSGVFWSSDLLPQALEGATILAYGFNTEVAGGADGPNFLNVQADMLVACLGSHRNASTLSLFS